MPSDQLFQTDLALSPANQAALLRFAGLVLKSDRAGFTDILPAVRLQASACGLLEMAEESGNAMQATPLGEAALNYAGGPV